MVSNVFKEKKDPFKVTNKQILGYMDENNGVKKIKQKVFKNSKGDLLKFVSKKR